MEPRRLETKAKIATHSASFAPVYRAEILSSTCIAEYTCTRFVKVTSPLKLVHSRMQCRPLGSGHGVRSLHCRYILVLNAVSPQRLAYHSHGPRLVVACSRFGERILQLLLLVLVRMLCRRPASIGGISVELGQARLHGDAAERLHFFPEGHRRTRRRSETANASKQGGPTPAIAPLCLLILALFQYISAGLRLKLLCSPICSLCLCYRL